MTEKDTITPASDDELLSAYIDGELPAAESEQLTERLAKEPALVRRLEALRSADERTRDLYAALDRAPMPQSVLDLLNAPEGGTADAPAADKVIRFPARPLTRFFELPVAIAASVALLAGLLLADVFREVPGAGAGTLTAGAVPSGTALNDLLETGQGGRTVELADGVSGRVHLTFEDGAGDWCRQVSVGGAALIVHGVACRRGGDWRMETVALGSAMSPGGTFATASDASPPAVEAAVDALIGPRSPLGEEKESLVISEGWKKTAE